MEKVYEKDSSANAAVIYQSQKTFFNTNAVSVELVTQMHKRIKIYNKDGFEKATFTLNLFKSRSSREHVGKIKAYTYNI